MIHNTNTLLKIEKEINKNIKYKNQSRLICIFKIVKNNNEYITYKKSCILFNLRLCNPKTINELCKYLNIKEDYKQ